ncbi:hypothetical protein [Rhizobium leguminosarum]|uniref:DUF1579 domain-containing protein n=1 Tax=Rhizobium leguminosarum TaxID=384 RepID=A0A1B1CJS3_RHILE|nr:hypothetical protein [Rhizobium leguminosarum]ANP90007.1 hypothetical protein BA011_26375 [Rhizobium leguminosarum]
MSFQLQGRWTYRSYRNDAALVAGNEQKALQDIFGEGIFTLAVSNGKVTGALDMGSGYVLDLSGPVVPVSGGEVQIAFTIIGTGRSGTPTAGWEYDYHGTDAFTWPKGIDQVPAIVGSVLRAKPHNGSPAGYVASFIAIKRA